MKGTWDGDRDPLAALRAGNRGPFEEFVRTEAGTFLGFFQRLGAERGEAEDLAQEVFLKLYKSAPTYADQSRFSSYALRVARNAWIDRRRRKAVRVDGASLDDSQDEGASLLERLPSQGPETSSRAERAEERERLAVALRQLPESHASVFELAVLQELPYSEVSAVLGIPVGTVKSRVFHALRKLRDALGGGGEE